MDWSLTSFCILGVLILFVCRRLIHSHCYVTGGKFLVLCRLISSKRSLFAPVSDSALALKVLVQREVHPCVSNQTFGICILAIIIHYLYVSNQTLGICALLFVLSSMLVIRLCDLDFSDFSGYNSRVLRKKLAKDVSVLVFILLLLEVGLLKLSNEVLDFVCFSFSLSILKFMKALIFEM